MELRYKYFVAVEDALELEEDPPKPFSKANSTGQSRMALRDKGGFGRFIWVFGLRRVVP